LPFPTSGGAEGSEVELFYGGFNQNI